MVEKRKNQKVKKVIICVIISMSLIFTTVLSSFAAYLLDWWLLDSGGHLDWGGSTSYQTSFNTGVNTWNARKSGMIRADTASTIQDVTISDYTEENATAAQTSSWGYIRFNTHIMKKLTSSEKKNVCTHELGHALGIGHLSSGDVMYFAVSSVYSLSTNDKNAFTSSWIRIFGIPG